MNIVVVAGGFSTEREVSLTSGSLIANALLRRGHRVVLVDPYLGLPTQNIDFSDAPIELHRVSTEVPDLEALWASRGGTRALVAPGVIELCQRADVVFNAMHGGMGEDGRMQALLDCYGIPYTGTGALGAMLSMDKQLAKSLMEAVGIQTPKGIVVCQGEQGAAARILAQIGLPCVVKPLCGGSSVGVSMADTEQQLNEALEQGFRYESRLLVEKRVIGRELTVGILGGVALPPVEIVPHEGFYDYQNKYQSGRATELCPAPLTAAQTERLQDITRRGFEALRLSSYARFDYLMDENDSFFCLEANALPGMTPTSLLPQMAAAVGMDYDTLCERIVMLALEKANARR